MTTTTQRFWLAAFWRPPQQREDGRVERTDASGLVRRFAFFQDRTGDNPDHVIVYRDPRATFMENWTATQRKAVDSTDCYGQCWRIDGRAARLWYAAKDLSHWGPEVDLETIQDFPPVHDLFHLFGVEEIHFNEPGTNITRTLPL